MLVYLYLSHSASSNQSSTDAKVFYLTHLVTKLYDLHAPVRPVNIKHLPAHWLSVSIKKLMTKRNKAKNKCKKFPSAENVAVYKKLRNLCNRMCRDAKRRYIFSSIESFSSSSQAWRFLKSLGLGKFLAASSGSINLNDFNTHFSTPPTTLHNSTKSFTLNKLAYVNLPKCLPFSFEHITEEEVKKSILAISSKAAGHDDLRRDMLVLILDFIWPIITHILNFSPTTKVLPTSWKMAHNIPLPKATNPSSLSQFRPISILPILSKIIESAVSKQLSSFLYQNNLLSSYQSGFSSTQGH